MAEASEGDPTGSLLATFKGIGAIVAPTSLVTALLYYFGWVRTDVQADQLGFDESMLGYSIQDYLLNSMSSMFGPLLIGLLAALVGLAVHGLVVLWARRFGIDEDGPRGARGRQLISRLAAVIAAGGLTALIVGIVGTQFEEPSDGVYVGAPVAVTVGIVLLVYAASLYRRFVLAGRPNGAIRAFEGYNVAVTAVIVMLVLLSLFWNVSHYAVVKGRTLAATVEAIVPSRPEVIIYSQKPLYLQPPVKETRLADDPTGYRFAYQNLKLLFRAGGKYFLRPSDTSVRLNIILPDSPDIRIELYTS